ncbi:MAG: VOC family protein [Acidobacteriota bacterium]|nr:VOC family protein [Acidobacteriota bacterium]
MNTESKTAAGAAVQANVEEAVPFFSVSDIEKSLQFYVQGLGFEVALKWMPEGRIRWCRLQNGGAGLMLQEFGKTGLNTSVPAGKAGVGVSVCFTCKDALAIYRQAKQNGLVPKEPFVGNGLWVTSFSDPDGYRIDFDSPTDVPEETTLLQWEASHRPSSR